MNVKMYATKYEELNVPILTEGPVPRDNENELNQPPTDKDWSAGNTD